MCELSVRQKVVFREIHVVKVAMSVKVAEKEQKDRKFGKNLVK